MRLLDVHHVSLNVADAEVARHFYEEVLGLALVASRPDLGVPGYWLQAGTTQIHLIEVPEHRAPEGQHVAFQVADIDESVADLRDRGVEVSDVFVLPGAGRQAFFHDPSRNLIELNQPDPDR